MYYVYALAFERNVFYIGMTKDPVKRFRDHVNGCTAANRFIRYIVTREGMIPRMDILEAFDNYIAATRAEHKYIQRYSTKYHQLLNDNNIFWFISRNFPNIRKMPIKNIVKTREKHIQLQILKAHRKYEQANTKD